MITLVNGDSEKELQKLKSNSIDSIICDPPYGIGINGEAWDKSLPNSQIWRECFRVLKPGGFICAMSGSRLYHKLASEIESMGFVTHQMMIWAYSSGMPKGMCLAKMMDQYDERNVPDDKFRTYLRSALKKQNMSANQVEKLLGIKGMFSHYLGKSQPKFPSSPVWKKLKDLLKLDETYDASIKENYKRPKDTAFSGNYLQGLKRNYEPYSPKCNNAKTWFGYRYGLQTLRPSLEPIYIGQKPVEKNVVENIFKYKTGAINISKVKKDRYPSNLLNDGSILMNKIFKTSKHCFDMFEHNSPILHYSKSSRDSFNNHPTVKPLSLMEHLVNLYTPTGGIVLDPFMGSGTTGVASIINGFKFIGIENDANYFEIAKRRLSLKNVI